MDEIYMRNNIYFFYLKENIENIEILYDKTGTLYNLTGQKIGNKYALYANKDYIFAPIDLLLYHVKSLEYLNRNYTKEEIIKLKENKMAPCYQRRAKYFYNITEILLLNKEVKNISANIIELIIQDYKDYFATRHEDPILKIYTTKHYN